MGIFTDILDDIPNNKALRERILLAQYQAAALKERIQLLEKQNSSLQNKIDLLEKAPVPIPINDPFKE